MPGVDDPEEAERNVVKAIGKGLLKTISKMGISTIQSYCGAQIFEAVGLREGARSTGTSAAPRRASAASACEVLAAGGAGPPRARPTRAARGDELLPVGGVYAWRRDGEHHMWNPETIARCSTPCAARRPRRPAQESTTSTRAWSTRTPPRKATLRGLLQVPRAAASRSRSRRSSRPSEIVKRFATGAMSLGSISREAHETLAIAMNRLGGTLEHRRGRRGPVALHARRQRRPAPLGDQAGGLGPLRRDDPLPGQRRPAADQDGPGRQARRGRPAARPQGRRRTSARCATRRRASA